MLTKKGQPRMVGKVGGEYREVLLFSLEGSFGRDK